MSKMESMRIINSYNIHFLSNEILTVLINTKTIVKSVTSVQIEIREMTKRHQYTTKLQSELIKEKVVTSN